MRTRELPALILTLLLIVLASACGGGQEAEETAAPEPRAEAPAPAATPAAEAGASANIQVDPALPAYQKSSGVSGTLSSVGSDTLNNLMTLWAEEFKRAYPNVRIQVEGKGSSTAPPALIEGTAQLGPMSREMKPSEIDEFEKRYGYKPTAIRVAVDALAVYVHRDNPLEQLTIPEVDAIFSKGRLCGHAKAIETWGDAGAAGNLAGQRISLYGRNSASGTLASSRRTPSARGTSRTRSRSSPARPRSSRG